MKGYIYTIDNLTTSDNKLTAIGSALISAMDEKTNTSHVKEYSTSTKYQDIRLLKLSNGMWIADITEKAVKTDVQNYMLKIIDMHSKIELQRLMLFLLSVVIFALTFFIALRS